MNLFHYTPTTTTTGTSTTTTTTASTTTTTSSAATPTWSALGCYSDSSSRTLTGTSTTSTSLTYAFCQSYCQTRGYSYAGVEYGQECWCGNGITSPGAKVNR